MDGGNIMSANTLPRQGPATTSIVSATCRTGTDTNCLRASRSQVHSVGAQNDAVTYKIILVTSRTNVVEVCVGTVTLRAQTTDHSGVEIAQFTLLTQPAVCRGRHTPQAMPVSQDPGASNPSIVTQNSPLTFAVAVPSFSLDAKNHHLQVVI
nr:hypothetical protein BaRGS_012623 [Batillaria attramentaria]